jgi:hypothetical protein
MALTTASLGQDGQCAGQVGYWPLNGDAQDGSGLANHGTLFGEPAFGMGMAGLALLLDGIDDSALVADHPSLNPSAAISISAWYRPEAFSGSGSDPVVDKGAPSHSPPFYQYHLGVSGSLYPHSPGTIGMTIAAAGSSAGVGTDQGFLVNERWSHVASTYDGAMMRFYADGVEVSASPVTGPISAYGTPLWFGRFNNLGFHLRGAIDEIRIFDRALSPDEAALLHDSPDATPMALPAAQTVCRGSSFSLSVRMLADPSATFQWRRNGDPLVGETASTLTVTGAGPIDEGEYDCVVSGPCRSAVSTPATVAFCIADFNCDGLRNPDDLSEFITCFFLDLQFPGSCSGSDFNADGLLNPDDLSEFITSFFLALQFGC